MSVGEGAVRSGKTIDHCIIASIYLEYCPDKLHLATGSTIANAKTNIGDCNGYGLEHIFRGRCRWGKYKDNECLYIQTKTGEKIVIFAGGGHADSYKKILGNSYGLWIATEINEHYDSDDSRESFIKVAFGRQVAAEKPMVLWDLNPCAPKHKIYTDYIDKYKDTYVGGYNYEHFTIADNLSITPQRRAEIESQYDINSIWYKRDILGMRCVAEGLVFQQYANSPEDYDVEFEEIKNDIMFANIGIDFGGTGSAHSFVCTAYTKRYKKIVPILSERHEEELNPEELNEVFAKFVKKCYNLIGKPMNVYCDSAEQVLIRGFKTTVLREQLPVNIYNARKLPILERIKLLNKLIALGVFGVCTGANTVKIALCEALWDRDKTDTRLDDGTTDIDTCDALEYSIEPQFADLSRL